MSILFGGCCGIESRGGEVKEGFVHVDMSCSGASEVPFSHLLYIATYNSLILVFIIADRP